MSMVQKSDESFYQFVVRTTRETEKWAKLAMPESSAKLAMPESSSRSGTSQVDESGRFASIVQQVLLESVGANMKAFMIEKKCYTKDMKVFAEKVWPIKPPMVGRRRRQNQ